MIFFGTRVLTIPSTVCYFNTSLGMSITAHAISGIKDVQTGDNLGELILGALKAQNLSLAESDILVIASKVVSKSEGRIVHESEIEVSPDAKLIAERNDFDPVQVQLALNEAVDVISSERALITRSVHGFVCNFSGVDKSNAAEGTYILLPEDADQSAENIRSKLEELSGRKLAVIVSDTQGRPWRKGSLNLAIGCAGIGAYKHNKGRRDLYGRTLERSLVCQVDELAALAEPLMGQAGEGIPVVVIRGYTYYDDGSRCKDINRSAEENIIRKKE